MNPFLKLAARSCLAVPLLAGSLMAGAQNNLMPWAQDITVVVTNGKTGKPLPNERVIVFEFNGEPPQHDVTVELHTDSNGVAILHASDISRKRLQLWVDKKTQCVADPNHVSFDVWEIRKNGVKGSNSCAGFLDSTLITPSTLEVFARPATFRERMGW